MEGIFSFRIDKETSNKLHMLADSTFRSRASVVRWLINLAVQNPNLLLPEVGVSADGPSTPDIEPTKGSKQEVQQ